MSVIGKALKRGIRKLERLNGSPVFTWKDSDYPCMQNVPKLSRILGIGGFSPQAELSLFVRVDVLPSEPRPASGHTIEFDGRTYRIDKIEPLPGGDVLQYDCVHPTRGVNAK